MSKGKLHLFPEEQTAMDRLRETATIAEAHELAKMLQDVLHRLTDKFPVAMSAVEIMAAMTLWSVRESMAKDLGRPLEESDYRECADAVANRVHAHLCHTLQVEQRRHVEAARAAGRDEIESRRKPRAI